MGRCASVLAFVASTSLYVWCDGSTEIPQQTPEQRRVIDTWTTAALHASAAAAAQASSLFSHPATNEYLRQFDDGTVPPLWKLSAQELEARFWAEIETAELVHNFGEGNWSGSNCGYDLTIPLLNDSDVFYNQWQLQVNGDMPLDVANNFFTEWTETHLFNFTKFKQESHPDAPTAASRPVYAALNMYRSAGGNPQCGPVSAILRKSFLQGNAIISPVDSGMFSSCRLGEPAFAMNNQTIFRCTAWPSANRTLGVLKGRGYMEHVLTPYLNFFNATQAQAGIFFPQYNLARLLTRLLSRKTYTNEALPLTFIENTLGYFEANPIVNLTTAHGIQMLVGMFELLFGTDEGRQLQDYASKLRVPLAWAFNPEMSFFRCGPAGVFPACTFPTNFSMGIDTANRRILDLHVQQFSSTGTNISMSPAAATAFNGMWEAFNVKNNKTHAEIAAAWDTLSTNTDVYTSAAIEPLFVGACANPECVGVTIHTRDCLCP